MRQRYSENCAFPGSTTLYCEVFDLSMENCPYDPRDLSKVTDLNLHLQPRRWPHNTEQQDFRRVLQHTLCGHFKLLTTVSPELEG